MCNVHNRKWDYYDRNSKLPVFEVGQRVRVYTPKTKKDQLLHIKRLGPYRIVKQSSPVHCRLRAENNK